MKITLIGAVSEDQILAKKEGGLPWHLPEEIAWFREMIQDHVLFVGRKTYEESTQLFLHRPTFILSSDPHLPLSSPEHHRCKSVQDAILKAESLGYQELWVLGGAQVFRETLPFANELLISTIHQTYPELESPVRFPSWPRAEWTEVWCRHHPVTQHNPIAFTSSRFLKAASASNPPPLNLNE